MLGLAVGMLGENHRWVSAYNRKPDQAERTPHGRLEPLGTGLPEHFVPATFNESVPPSGSCPHCGAPWQQTTGGKPVRHHGPQCTAG